MAMGLTGQQSASASVPHVPSANVINNVRNNPRCEYQARFSPVGDPGKYLAVAGSGGQGTRVLLWSATGGQEQVWCEQFNRDGTSVLHPSYNLSLCLDVQGGPSHFHPGAPLQVWKCNGGTNQAFLRTYPVFHSGIVRWERPWIPDNLCLSNGNYSRGNVVTLAGCGSGRSQQWYARSTDGSDSNGLGEQVAWSDWQHLGQTCYTSPLPFQNCIRDWCTYWSRYVWRANAVQGTGILTGQAPSFADGPTDSHNVPDGRGYATAYHAWDSQPRVGDALVWQDESNDNERGQRIHAEIVVWVDPSNPKSIETIGGAEGHIFGGAWDKIFVRGGNQADHGQSSAPIGGWKGYDWTQGLSNGWKVYEGFVRPINSTTTM
ncbi:RICIN domain-containing protein [Streptomyces hyaluromycini]|uniref:RICIN domain-containing protein n=1 Tax=Streptomyces hyaluromycini TaxID=1377993 RepID=UPI00142DD1F1|nr:ricin-type beta-trefoil lectin domain protein [Streptomyces hyaluromycini]